MDAMNDIDITLTSEIVDNTKNRTNRICGYNRVEEDGWLNEQPIEFFDSNFQNIRKNFIFSF